MTERPEEQKQEQAEKQGGESDKQAPTAPPDSNPADQEDGRTPPPDDLTEDPAYEPEDEGLKGIKGA